MRIRFYKAIGKGTAVGTTWFVGGLFYSLFSIIGILFFLGIFYYVFS